MGDAACEGGHQIVFVVWVELMVFAPVTSKVACASNLENLGSGTLMTMRATYTPSVCGVRAGNHLSFFLHFFFYADPLWDRNIPPIRWWKFRGGSSRRCSFNTQKGRGFGCDVSHEAKTGGRKTP